MKCCGMGCQMQGEAAEGFDFFVCDGCLNVLDYELRKRGIDPDNLPDIPEGAPHA